MRSFFSSNLQEVQNSQLIVCWPVTTMEHIMGGAKPYRDFTQLLQQNTFAAFATRMFLIETICHRRSAWIYKDQIITLYPNVNTSLVRG